MRHEFHDAESNVTAIAVEGSEGWYVRLWDDDAEELVALLFVDDEATAIATAKNLVGQGSALRGTVSVRV